MIKFLYLPKYVKISLKIGVLTIKLMSGHIWVGIITGFLLLSVFPFASGQVNYANNSDATDSKALHSPKKAALYSAIFPGLGQVYNKKYWKLPIIYGGIGTIIYFIDFNSKRYNLYKKAYIDMVYSIPNGSYTNIENWNKIPNLQEQLKNLKDYYHRNRDFSYILLGAVYMLNIVDATVDAHMFTYDISKDLSLKAEPALLYNNLYATSGIGLKLSLKFNKN